jgi:lipoate-protein ligase A
MLHFTTVSSLRKYRNGKHDTSDRSGDKILKGLYAPHQPRWRSNILQNINTRKNQWYIYPLTTADQQHHIEQSEHLLNTIQPGEQAILYWSLAEPTGVVLGFSQKQTVLNAGALTALSLSVYQRRAGGTAVLVGPDLLSLDILLPAGHPLILADIVESYRWLGEAWVTTFHRLGIETRTVQPDEAHAQRILRKQPQTCTYEKLMNRACYGTLSPYEVIAGQRKVVGLDMIRRRAGSLLQAGVLLRWDTHILAQLLGQTREEQALLRQGLRERAVGLDTLAGRPVEINEIIAMFEQVITSEVLFYGR